MTGLRLRTAALIGAASAAIVFVLLRGRPTTPRVDDPPPPGAEAPSEVAILFARTSDRDLVLRRRFAAPHRAAYADGALKAALAGPAFPSKGSEDPPEHVELWIRARAAVSEGVPAGTPVVAAADGRRFALTAIDRALGDPPSGMGRLLATALGGGAGKPLEAGALRRITYALPPGIPFATLTSADVDGVPLKSAVARTADLDAWPDDPGRDAAAFLIDPTTRRVAEAAPPADARREDDR